MSDYKIIQLAPHFSFEVGQGLPVNFTVNADIEKRADQIWDEEQKKLRGALYNGLIFHLIDVKPDKISGTFIEYRYFLAQLMDSSLRQHLPFRAVGMGGVTTCEDKILLGRRSERVTEYRGYLETVPSGTLDSNRPLIGEATIREALLQELQEEAGIESSAVKEVSNFSIVIEDDVGAAFMAKIVLLPGTRCLSKTPEYTELYWVEPANLRKKIEQTAEEFVPLTLCTLKLFGYRF